VFVWVLSWGWSVYAQDGIPVCQLGRLIDVLGDEPVFELKGRFIQVQSRTARRPSGVGNPRGSSVRFEFVSFRPRR